MRRHLVGIVGQDAQRETSEKTRHRRQVASITRFVIEETG